MKNFNGLTKRLLLHHFKFDTIAMTETHLTENVDSKEVYIEGYNIHRLNRQKNKSRGRCAICVKDNLDITVMTENNTENIEVIWIELHLCSQQLIIGTVYRPPDDLNFCNSFQVHREKVSRKRSNVLILGDLNSDFMLYGKSAEEKCLGRKLLNVLNTFSYKNIIKIPTGVTASTKTIIDLITVSDSSKVSNSGVADYSITDHKLVYAVLNLKKCKLPPRNQTVRDYKHLNVSDFSADIETAPCWICTTFQDIDDIAWSWEIMYKDIESYHIKKRKARVRSEPLPWVNGNIRKLMNQRYKLLRSCDGTGKT